MLTSASSLIQINNNSRLRPSRILNLPFLLNKFGGGKINARLEERETKEIKSRKSSVTNSDNGCTSEGSKENIRDSWIELQRGGRDNDDAERSAREVSWTAEKVAVGIHSPVIENESLEGGARDDDDDGDGDGDDGKGSTGESSSRIAKDNHSAPGKGKAKQKEKVKDGGGTGDDDGERKEISGGGGGGAGGGGRAGGCAGAGAGAGGGGGGGAAAAGDGGGGAGAGDGGGGAAAGAGGGGGVGGSTSDVSSQERISLLSLLNAAFACFIPLLFNVVQAEYRDPSPFHARPKSMWAFLLGAIIFYIGFAASFKFSGSEYSSYIDLAVIVAGLFTAVSLISALLPPLIALVLFVICGFISIVAVAICIIKSACPGIYNWIVETLRKIPSACCNWIMETFCTISTACRQCLSCNPEENEEKPRPAV